MSGGPLSVWDESAQTYYPAGIYLGGSGQGVVRALDSDVVDLFRLAEAQSTGGGQNVGGGITHSHSETISAAAGQGAIMINIEPAAARATARWGLSNEAPARPSGARYNGAKNSYTLRLNTLSGFLPPISPTVKIDSQKLNIYTFTYEAIPTRPSLDAWRREHYGASATNTGDAANTADPDGDGFTNEEEFAAATDPKDAGSAFSITSATHDGTSYTVTFNAQPDRRYVLQRWQPAPGAIWQPVEVAAPLSAAGPVSLTDPAAPAAAAFYRVHVSVP